MLVCVSLEDVFQAVVRWLLGTEAQSCCPSSSPVRLEPGITLHRTAKYCEVPTGPSGRHCRGSVGRFAATLKDTTEDVLYIERVKKP